MIKKCRFLAGCLTLSMIFASAVPAVFAEDAAVSEDETTAVEAIDEISDEAIVDEAVVDESEEVDVLSEDDADVSVAAVDYSAWQKGDTSASDSSPGEIVPNTDYNGKDALYIKNRNAYTVLPDPISDGKVTFSLDLYLEKGARNFRIYLENTEASYTGTGNLFAEVLNNDEAGAVYFGPEEKQKDNAHKLFDIPADGWYHFDLSLDYDEAQSDGSVSDKFITINATDANGNPMCEERTIGAMGTNVALKAIRIVKTTSGLYAANMTIEQGGEMVQVAQVNFADAAVGELPAGWLSSVGSSDGYVKVVEESTKGKVLEIKKGYNGFEADGTPTTTVVTTKNGDITVPNAKNAVFAQYNLPMQCKGRTIIEADVNITWSGRPGLYASSSNEIDTSTVAPRFFAWGAKNEVDGIKEYPANAKLDGWQDYDGDAKGAQLKNPPAGSAPALNNWQTWKFDINAITGKYDIYVNGIQIYKDLTAGIGEGVMSVGFQIQNETTMLGTIQVAEIRVWNDSVVDPEKIAQRINDDLDRITLPESTEGDNISLPSKTPSYGYDITWTSSNPDVISNVGRVVRKDTVIGDVDVVLTATVTYEGTTFTRDFTVKSIDARDTNSLVKSQILADLMDVGLTEGDTVYSDIELPTVGNTYGTKISWITSNAAVISAKGKVNRPAVNGSKTVKMTAVGELEGVKETYAYSLKVPGKGAASSVSSGGGGGGGFVSNPSSSTTSKPSSAPAATENTGNTQNESNAGFNDLDSVAWAKEAIDYMFAQGYIDGVGDGRFAPNDAVTREQFVKMLVNVFGLEADSDNAASFADVQSGAWYAEYVNIAASLGIVSGMGDGSFGVGTPISRQDMAVMIARCTNVEGGDAAEFADDSAISDYAADAVHAMKSAGYLSGDEKGNFNPKNTATRAETATVLYRISAGK